MAASGEYLVIGHSLGGVLLRSALCGLAADTRMPSRLFLLASPVVPARLAQRLRGHVLFRALTRDCGDLLGSPARMAFIGEPPVPTTSIAGTRGLSGRFDPFDGERNDGIVASSEVRAHWVEDHVEVRTVHTFLPSSAQVAAIVLDRVAAVARERPE